MRQIIFIFSLFHFTATQAAFSGAVTTATAGTGRASAENTGSFFLNPATLNYLKGYQLNTTYNTALAKNNQSFRDFQIFAFDNTKDSVIPTALSFREQQVFTDEKVRVTKTKWNEINLVLSKKILPRLSMGGTVNYRTFYPASENNLEAISQWNGSLGFLLAPQENFGFGLVFENPFPGSPLVPEEYRYFSKTSLGASYILSQVVKLKADFSTARNNSWSKPTAGLGVEAFMNSWLIWRLGASQDFDLKVQTYAMGIGFQGPKFGIHYGYERSDLLFERHAVDLTMPLW